MIKCWKNCLSLVYKALIVPMNGRWSGVDLDMNGI